MRTPFVRYHLTHVSPFRAAALRSSLQTVLAAFLLVSSEVPHRGLHVAVYPSHSPLQTSYEGIPRFQSDRQCRMQSISK